jgi:hypothetical protein
MAIAPHLPLDQPLTTRFILRATSVPDCYALSPNSSLRTRSRLGVAEAAAIEISKCSYGMEKGWLTPLTLTRVSSAETTELYVPLARKKSAGRLGG